MRVVIIAAVGENGVIGNDGSMPWHYPRDLEHFKETTMGYPVVMGRVTYERIVDRIGGPLSGRTNIVLTRDPERIDSSDTRVRVATTLDEALEHARESGADQVFVAGGGSVYEQALPVADRLILTEIHDDFEGDTTFPEWDDENWRETDRETTDELSFVTYDRRQGSATDG